MEKLQWSDAWLLLAIYYARQCPLLSKIIACADYINHAIINYEELTSGLVRLEQSGFIKIAPDLTEVTCLPKSLEIIEEFTPRFNTAYEVKEAIEKAINAYPWNSKDPIPHPANNLTYPGLTINMYTLAVNEYLKTMK